MRIVAIAATNEMKALLAMKPRLTQPSSLFKLSNPMSNFNNLAITANVAIVAISELQQL